MNMLMPAMATPVLKTHEAALWFLGQAGYLFRAGEVAVAIDPYLTDSVGAIVPDFSRCIPSPLAPEELAVDLYLVTHDHLDHLDPETIARYQHKEETMFVAPRLASIKLRSLGVPARRIRTVDASESAVVCDVTVEGIFALPTGRDVLDTVGYRLLFPNGRSVYHASDTAFCPLLLQAAPKGVDVLIVPINGKWGNLNVAQAVELTQAVGPCHVLPCHYDVMALNAENPETFLHLCRQAAPGVKCVVPQIMQPFIWGEQ